MDRQLTVNSGLILCVLRHALIQKPLKNSKLVSCSDHTHVHVRERSGHETNMNHGQSNSSMATKRTETTHGLTYSVARVIDITAWQSVNAVCVCCLTHGAYVKVTGLQPLLTTTHGDG